MPSGQVGAVRGSKDDISINLTFAGATLAKEEDMELMSPPIVALEFIHHDGV